MSRPLITCVADPTETEDTEQARVQGQGKAQEVAAEVPVGLFPTRRGRHHERI